MRALWLLAAAAAAACAVAASGAARDPLARGGSPALLPWSSASPRDLAKGKLLIARPQAGGAYFYESVVLLLEYEPEGAIGLIINRPMEIDLARLLPDIEALQGRPDRAYFGGPVERERMMLLYRSSQPLPDSQPVVGDIHASGSFETLRMLVESGATETRFRAYIGYAGWGSGQLAGEVERGDWLIAPGEASAVFEMDSEKVWREFIDRSSGLEADWRPEGGSGRESAVPGVTARARVRATPPPDPAHRRPRAAGR